MDFISICMFSVGIIILLFCLTRRNSNFLDIRKIIADHFRIFKGCLLQLVAIYVSPAIFAIGIVRIRCVDREILNSLIVVLSILVAMFFSVLSILSAFNKEHKSEDYKQLLNETFTTTLFEILLCLALLIASFIALFVGKINSQFLMKFGSGCIYYLAIVIVLNILLVSKRMKVLFENG